MADYPEWVLTHKKKGTYVNKVGDKYYLYAAHSERIPGTKRVRRVCDGYLGRITEKDGLIPPKEKVSAPVATYEFGLSSLVLSLCQNVHKGFRKGFSVYGDFIMAAAILTFIYGFYTAELLEHSWLSIHFPCMKIPIGLTEAQKSAMERGERMVLDTMKNTFSSDLDVAKASFSLVILISINDKYYLSEVPDSVNELKLLYHLDWRPEIWLK